MDADFPLPDVAWPPARPFWEGAARGVLRIPRCDACERLVWYPGTPCRWCGGSHLRWGDVSGRGRLFSWSVVRHAWIPQVADRLPFVTGLVALEEDPAVRLVTYVVDCVPEALRCDVPVRAVFRALRYPGVERTVIAPMFTPADT
ncbi:MAG TPA: OB-fold domain-containing protein [Candidatus Binatia bacterium]|nr:OB-fold domain-containing protein [Candidatus Binatia bacterium]